MKGFHLRQGNICILAVFVSGFTECMMNWSLTLDLDMSYFMYTISPVFTPGRETGFPWSALCWANDGWLDVWAACCLSDISVLLSEMFSPDF